jgi:hypothetical protein
MQQTVLTRNGDFQEATNATFLPTGFPDEIFLPTFDLHKVEEALKVNHVLFNGTPLSLDEINTGITQYRQFLANHKAKGCPERFTVPSYLVDRVWHTHMCETDQYQNDMVNYFGKMLHHRSEICNGGAGWDAPAN